MHRLPVAFEAGLRLWLSGLEDKLSSINPDLVIVHSVSHFITFRTAWMKARRRFSAHCRLVADDHMLSSLYKNDHQHRTFYWAFRIAGRPILTRFFDRFVAVTEDTKQFMVEHYGLPTSMIEVIPIGVDTGLFKYDAIGRNEIRKRLGFPANACVFAHVGKILRSRQIEQLVLAAIPVLRCLKDARLLLVGPADANYVSGLRSLLKNAECDAQVTFHPAVSHGDLPSYYSAADVGIWPHESLTLLEANSCGLPVLARSSPCNSERLRGGGGWLFTDESQLRGFMHRLAASPQLRQEMAEKARVDMRTRFDWHGIAERFTKLAFLPTTNASTKGIP